MSKYVLTFTDQEKNKFNIIENENIRKSCMSVYMYLLKLNEKKNNELSVADLSHLKETTKLNISFRKFLNAYNRNHNKLSLPTLKSRIDKLIELKLLTVEKNKNSFIYLFHRFTVNKNINEIPNNLKPTETIENTTVEVTEHECKYINSERVNYDLDSNSLITTYDNFNKENYIESLEKDCKWENICSMLMDAFKLLKVKSEWIKLRVIEKISKYHENITKKHAMAYICTCIKDAREVYYENYDKYIKKQSKPIELDTFNNFKQRSNYNFSNLNKMLTGEIAYNPDLLYA